MDCDDGMSPGIGSVAFLPEPLLRDSSAAALCDGFESGEFGKGVIVVEQRGHSGQGLEIESETVFRNVPQAECTLTIIS
jgi:hypothetical protein